LKTPFSLLSDGLTGEVYNNLQEPIGVYKTRDKLVMETAKQREVKIIFVGALWAHGTHGLLLFLKYLSCGLGDQVTR